MNDSTFKKWALIILLLFIVYMNNLSGFIHFNDWWNVFVEVNSMEGDIGAQSQRIIMFADAKKDQGVIDAGICLKEKPQDDHSYCLPSLICIGAMKAGTFELKQWLSVHKLVDTSDRELHYFGSGVIQEKKSKLQLSKYRMARAYVLTSQQWRVSDQRIRKGAITFEKTPYYMASVTAAREIRSLLPSVLMVCLLRDPVMRAYSAFMHHCNRKKRIVYDNQRRVVMNSDCNLEAHCCCSKLDNPKVVYKRPPECTPSTFDAYIANTEKDITSPHLGTIIRKGLYALELGEYLRLFPRNQLLVLDQKTFALDPASSVNRVLKFAGLEVIDFSGHTFKNDAGYIQLKGMDSKSSRQKPYAPMRSSTRSQLELIYAEPDRQLTELFPAISFSWINTYPNNQEGYRPRL